MLCFGGVHSREFTGVLLEVPIPKELVENSDWGLQLTANFVWTVGENQSSSTSGERRKRFVCPPSPAGSYDGGSGRGFVIGERGPAVLGATGIAFIKDKCHLNGFRPSDYRGRNRVLPEALQCRFLA